MSCTGPAPPSPPPVALLDVLLLASAPVPAPPSPPPVALLLASAPVPALPAVALVVPLVSGSGGAVSPPQAPSSAAAANADSERFGHIVMFAT
ncbi:hypothetical protein WME91_26080 [Sorangium sp. So ce269]